MDDIFVKNEDRPREIHPDGQFASVCVDLIDLGMKVTNWSGHEKASQSCVLVFWTGEKNKMGFAMEVAREFSVSFYERSNLSKFLEAWRGKPFTPEERNAGISLKTLVGKPCLLSIVHNVSKNNGKTYANIGAIMPLPKAMPAPSGEGYKRAEYWKMTKEKYAVIYKSFLKSDASGDVSYEGDLEAADADTPF